MLQLNRVESNFESFAEFLFNKLTPPKPNTVDVDIIHEMDDTTTKDFLYDLFLYGIKKKYGDVNINEIDIQKFNNIRDYIRALGFDTLINNHKYDIDGKLAHIHVFFQPYYTGL